MILDFSLPIALRFRLQGALKLRKAWREPGFFVDLGLDADGG